MSTDNKSQKSDICKSAQDILGSQVYAENVDFWNRAWSPVKTAYTQMPDLPYLTLMMSELASKAPTNVLDLGCGSGWLSILLARNGFDVTGVDVAEQAINLANDWANQESHTINFQVKDMALLEFSPGTFEACVANSIFEHFPLELTRTIFKQLKTIIAVNGVFIGCFDKVGTGPGEYYKLEDETHVYTDKGRKGMLLRCYSDEELEEILTDSGFTITYKETFESGTRYIVAIQKSAS